MKNRIFASVALALLGTILSVSAQAQVPVAIAPSAHPQFVDGTGKVLAGGFLYTYSSGTTTRLDTYTDSTGSIINAWPIPLDSTGSPSNASGAQTGIFLSNNTYRFCAQNSSLVQQWCVDGVNSYSILNNLQNLTLSAVTSDPTGSAGELGYRSDIPCFRGFTVSWDCFVRLGDVQTLTNKTLTSPTINTPTVTNPTISGGGSWAGSPSLTNPAISGVNAQTGTSYTVLASDEQKLVTFNNGSSVAVTLPQATTAGFGSGTVFHFRNLGSGTVTITPTVSTIDGAANLAFTTTQGADIYSDGANYETQRGAPANLFPSTVYNAAGNNNGNFNATMVASVPASAGAAGVAYRFSIYLDVQTIGTGCTTNTTIVPSVTFTDPNAGGGNTINLSTASIVNNGVAGTPLTGSGQFSLVFRAKTGTAVSWATTYTAGSNCAPSPTYMFGPELEQLSVNP